MHRYDYEGVDSAKADKVMKTLLDKMGQTTQVLPSWHMCSIVSVLSMSADQL